MHRLTRRQVLIAVPGAAVLGCSAAAAASQSAAAVTSSTTTVGEQQSPVAITSAQLVRRADLPPLVLDYACDVDLSLSYVSNDGLCGTRGPEESVRATVPAGAGTATVGGTVYQLKQFHFHTPAEHTINGVRYPVEQHFVHASADGRLLVVGLLLHQGANAPVDPVLRNLPSECGPALTVTKVDLARLVAQSPTVVRYAGSLTTSPYTEGVSWNVLPVPGRVSRDAVLRLKALFPAGDARPLQPLAGRELDLVRGLA